MRLKSLSPAEGAKHSAKRLGRGIGSGLGKLVVVVIKVKNLVLAAVFVVVSRVAKCHYTVVYQNLVSLQ